MTKSAYQFMAETWQNKEDKNFKDLMWYRLIEWRREPAVVRVEHPTRLDRARRLGFKAKQGYAIARVRVRRGGRHKLRPTAGRKPINMGVTRFTHKSMITSDVGRADRNPPSILPISSTNLKAI